MVTHDIYVIIAHVELRRNLYDNFLEGFSAFSRGFSLLFIVEALFVIAFCMPAMYQTFLHYAF